MVGTSKFTISGIGGKYCFELDNDETVGTEVRIFVNKISSSETVVTVVFGDCTEDKKAFVQVVDANAEHWPDFANFRCDKYSLSVGFHYDDNETSFHIDYLTI